ncbi:hypothetical protein SAMN05216387_10177 [Nitrosovibrio tenuis]|uniref:Uncharacterized protein n=2 Tax=Nitrosovibrio tenuis TaxID=1233 RepID=A0A1H7FT52_9PROT|nr:hypothetical protein SAMN05216387_10177 [Nitrosovibrio tenuis]
MITFVVIVDPYDQYRIVVLPGFNLVKPGLTRYQSEIKLTHAADIQADALIYGHSRAEVGFDPEAPVFARHGLSAYNLAIPGTGIFTARKQAEYLHRIGIKPKVIILGVEFLDFMEASHASPSVIAKARAPDDQHPVTQWFWRFDSLFSLASIKDAIRTLYLQHDNEADTMTSRGFNPLSEYGPIVRSEGYFTLFQQRAQENTRIYLRKAKGSLSLADFGHLRAILDMAAESGSDVNLIIYPYHAQIFALFEEIGLVHAFEEWKNLLINEISAAQLRHPDARIALFDFSGYSSYNCEKVPAKGDRVTATRWYWEAGHFKKQLGDVVLESMFSRSTNPLLMVRAGSEVPEKFGFQLEEANKSQNAQRIHLERSECMRNYPELFAEVEALVANERTHKRTAH